MESLSYKFIAIRSSCHPLPQEVPEKGAQAAVVLFTLYPCAAVREVVIHITELVQRALNNAIIEK